MRCDSLIALRRVRRVFVIQFFLIDQLAWANVCTFFAGKIQDGCRVARASRQVIPRRRESRFCVANRDVRKSQAFGADHASGNVTTSAVAPGDSSREPGVLNSRRTYANANGACSL